MYNGGFQTLNCHYSFGIHPKWSKFCVALVTRYDLLSKQTLEPLTVLRRISCHGKNHSHTRCEYSETIFLCYHHYSEYSLLGSKFSTNLLFAASKCHVTIQRQWQFKMFKMAKGSDGCSGETLLAPCTRKKRLQRKMTKDNYWIGVQENIGMFGKP